MTKIALLNLPHHEPVIRRFRCSYRAQNFLFPPYELLSIGGVLGEVHDVEVSFLDAIGARCSFDETAEWLKQVNPDIVIFQPGFEILSDDMGVVARLKELLPKILFTAIGYLPTKFTAEFMAFGPVDAVIIGEPELVARDMSIALRDGAEIKGIKGLAVKTEAGFEAGEKRARIDDLDVLPTPAYALANLKHYRELMMPQPMAVLQSGRGCPHKCTYCVKPYGHDIYFRSVSNVVEDIQKLIKDFGVKTVRFEDDVFTCDRARVMAFCSELAGLRERPCWTCLARPEDIDADLAQSMANGGCARVYLGVEHVVPELLKYLGREETLPTIEPAVKYLKRAGMEVAGFFMVGVPGETEEHFEELVKFAKRMRFDYIGVSTLVPYPGTKVFASESESIEFELLPFKSRFRDHVLREIAENREKRFYSSYIYSPRYMVSRLGSLIRNPISTIEGAFRVTSHLLGTRKADGKHGDLI